MGLVCWELVEEFFIYMYFMVFASCVRLACNNISLYCSCPVCAVELLWTYNMNGEAFCFYISWKNLFEIKINEIHCEYIIIGLISISKQIKRFSDFYTSSFVSFGNFFGVYQFCLHFNFWGYRIIHIIIL